VHAEETPADAITDLPVSLNEQVKASERGGRLKSRRAFKSRQRGCLPDGSTLLPRDWLTAVLKDGIVLAAEIERRRCPGEDFAMPGFIRQDFPYEVVRPASQVTRGLSRHL
jgi:hypothetical protein